MTPKRFLIVGATGGTGRCRAAEDLKLGGIPRISRADTAHFLLGLPGDDSSIGKTIRIGY